MKIILISLLFVSNSCIFAQPQLPKLEIDSLLEVSHVSNNDWVIGLSIDQAGIIPIYDSLGNLLYEPVLGSFLFSKIGEHCYVRHINYDYSNPKNDPTISFGPSTKLPTDYDITFTADSVKKACFEWIYPFTYKNDSLNYFRVQPPADHEQYYSMYFKTLTSDGVIVYFEETSLKENERFINGRNLNFSYNTSTFIFRAFKKLVKALDKNSKWSN